MIELLIAILIAMSTNTACDLGEPIDDWDQWAHEHQDASTVATFETDSGDVWLYHSETDDSYLLFVFRQDISDTLASGSGVVHGKCARLVEP